MANKTIQQLDPLTTADASDLLALYDVSGNGTNSITAANLLNTTTISGLETTAKTIPAAINELNNDLSKGYIKYTTFSVTNNTWASNTGVGSGIKPSGKTFDGNYNLYLDIPGIYLVIYHANFVIATSTGIRGIRFYEDETSVAEEFVGSGTNGTQITATRIIESDGTKTTRMGLYQNSGAAGNAANMHITAIKIA